jgi:hypothetical protein
VQDRPHMLEVGVCKHGAKKEVEDLIQIEMDKEENYKKASYISPPSSKTITKYRRAVFEELGLDKGKG